jgi:hypothetical protein
MDQLLMAPPGVNIAVPLAINAPAFVSQYETPLNGKFVGFTPGNKGEDAAVPRKTLVAVRALAPGKAIDTVGGCRDKRSAVNTRFVFITKTNVGPKFVKPSPTQLLKTDEIGRAVIV